MLFFISPFFFQRDDQDNEHSSDISTSTDEDYAFNDDTDEEFDLYKSWKSLYADEYKPENLYERLPRWRAHYEVSVKEID